jgi:hypothetical protein
MVSIEICILKLKESFVKHQAIIEDTTEALYIIPLHSTSEGYLKHEAKQYRIQCVMVRNF